MANTVVAAILTLNDKMSTKLVKVGRHWDDLTKAEQRSAKSAIASIDSMQKKADKFMSSAVKWGAGLAAVGLGIGFKEAFDLESYRSQLETATRDTERAAAVMTYAVKMAGATPYESGELVSASAALEMANLKAEDYLTTLGDTAAGTNKTIADVQRQFVKAFSTGYTAEFFQSINVSGQSFKEFAKANKLATSSIADTQVALKKFLDVQFGGGMEKLSHTVKGAWASITDIGKLSITRIVGMGQDGTVRAGSALDKLREKMFSVSATLDKWQEDGTLDKIAGDIGTALEKVWDIGEKVFSTIYKYRDLIGVLAGVGTAVWAITKAMAAYKAIAEAVRVVSLLLNGTLMASPWMIVILALGLAVTAGSTFVSKIQEVNKETGEFGATVDMINSGLDTMSKYFEGGIFSGIGNTIAGGIGSIYNGIVDVANVVGAPVQNAFNLKPIEHIDFAPAYANGTQYHSGGLALVGERGPELVNLPSGSRVTSAENTTKLGGQTVVNNFISINGAQKSDEELANIVAKRIIEETQNAW